MTARERWKLVYRRIRIARRECLNAQIDALVVGTGFLQVDPDGYVRRIPPKFVHAELVPIER